MRYATIRKAIAAGFMGLIVPIASHASPYAGYSGWQGWVQNGGRMGAINPWIAGGVIFVGPMIQRNIMNARRESGVGAQILYGATGISAGDIQRHGIFGGENSFFRKPFGTLFGN